MLTPRNGHSVLVALVSLGAVACYKSVDYTKLKCLPDGSGCPTGYYCSLLPSADHGACVRGTVAPDGSSGDVSASARPDGAQPDAHAFDARRGDGVVGGGEVGSDVPIGPPTGTPCQSATDCGGGYCVDGVCCDSACAGQCQSCKEVGSVGQCKPVKGPPIGGRPACGGTGVCQSQCDGIHGDACAYPDSATVCVPASCTAGKVTTASVCDTAGACSTPAVSACPGNQCAADGSAKCATTCTATSCGVGAYCDTTGACLPTQPAGASCSAGAQCASGYCVDGICCDGKCDGQCESCKEAGSVGKCKAVTGAPLATRTACGGTGGCKGQCDGTNGKACAFPDSATICTPASCTDGKATTASVCNGSGACTTPATSQCASNLCGTDGKCSGSCTATSCAAGTYCDSTGSCVKTLDLGASCSSGTQCTSGFCVDGVCCNGKCDGQCQSCKAIGSVGTCKAIQGDPVSPRAACGGTGKCKAQCDGTNAAACTYPDSATICTAASCTAGKVTTASVCNSSGSCTASTTNACDSNLCAADGVSCAGSCTPTSCPTGTYCGAGGACTPKLTNGQPCSGAIQCTSGNCVDGVCCDGPCAGQCQSCLTTPGTCKSVTTPRTSCGGTGACAGLCNGTSAACTFPGSGTTCAGATCQNSTTALLPATCNGSGICSTQTASPCPAGQVCSGAGVCACPAGTCGATCQRCDGPCDIYKAAGQPCVAAYSMVRALSSTYTGPLFQARSNSSTNNTGTGGITKDIGMLPDGYADTATVDAHCGSTVCTVSILYDQSGNGNNLRRGAKGTTAGGATAGEDDYESPANKGPVIAGGRKVYSLYMNRHEGYRTEVGVKGTNVGVGSAAQSIYELADGTHYGTACCWDFGNVTPDPTKYAFMNTLFFGTAYWGRGAGTGPWFMADYEGGVWAGGTYPGDPGWGALDSAGSSPANINNPSLKVPFAFGILKNDPTKWTLRMADLQTADDLTTAFDGGFPQGLGYNMQGGVVLGVAGDNSNSSWGTFFEGAIVSGIPSTATDLLVFKNVKAVGYTK